jgi:hypothetical protein
MQIFPSDQCICVLLYCARYCVRIYLIFCKKGCIFIYQVSLSSQRSRITLYLIRLTNSYLWRAFRIIIHILLIIVTINSRVPLSFAIIYFHLKCFFARLISLQMQGMQHSVLSPREFCCPQEALLPSAREQCHKPSAFRYTLAATCSADLRRLWHQVCLHGQPRGSPSILLPQTPRLTRSPLTLPQVQGKKFQL